MSYLDRPRLTFAGRFEADVSTVNNNPNNFNDATFLPEYDQPGTPVAGGDMTNGWWNPTGTGIWRLIDCFVTSATGIGGPANPADPIFRMAIADASDRPPAKLVDLDPMQQMVSTIFGLQVRLLDQATGRSLLWGEFTPAPFTNIWFGRSTRDASAVYQSQLRGADDGSPTWAADIGTSAFLNEFRHHARDLSLSVRFVLDGMVLNPTSEMFPTGRIVGAIGIAHEHEPKHFVKGRQLFVPLNLTVDPSNSAYGNPTVDTVNNAVAILRDDVIVLDLANSLQTKVAGGAVIDVGVISVGMLRDDVFTPVGSCPEAYRADGWLEQTSGIVEIEVPNLQQLACATPLALCMTDVARSGAPLVCPVEAPGGYHVRADGFVFRSDPDETIDVTIFTTKFGQPVDVEIDLAVDQLTSYLNQLQPRVANPNLPGPPGAAGPSPGKPTDALAFPEHLSSKDGVAKLRITTADPHNPRGYIDGQVYTVRPTLPMQPAAFVNPVDTISIHLYDKVDIPEEPTWWDDVQPILQQYANLYPIMRKVLDLDDYTSVIAHKAMLKNIFSLPESHPNYMPVTRDLSPAKRILLLRWLESAVEPRMGIAPPRLSAPNSHVYFALRSQDRTLEAAGATAAVNVESSGKFFLEKRAQDHGQGKDQP